MVDYKISWEIQDGLLKPTDGRIIMYAGLGIKSNSRTQDHNDLLRAFAARHKKNRDEVISNAARFYWRPVSKNKIIISPVRKIDEDYYDFKTSEFESILNDLFA